MGFAALSEARPELQETSALLQSVFGIGDNSKVTVKPQNHSKQAVESATGALQFHAENLCQGLIKSNMSQEDLSAMMTELQQQFSTQLGKEHATDQTLWNDATQKNTQCTVHTSRRFTSGGDANESLVLLDEYRKKLKFCHALDKAWLNHREAAQCVEPSSSFGAMTQQHQDFSDAIVKLRVSIAAYLALPASTSLPSGCDVDQAMMEQQSCLARMTSLFACEAEDDCIQTVGLSDMKAVLQGNAEGRQRAKLDFDVMMCKIQHVLAKLKDGVFQDPVGDDVPDTCQNDTKLAVGELEFSFGIPHTTHCAEDPSMYPSPSTCQAWLQQICTVARN